MLYNHSSESISYYSKSNVIIWMTLAFQAGWINMGGFMACHRFVSHVTGFASFFGFEASQLRWDHALGMLSVPIFFLMGSLISGYLVDLKLRRHQSPRYDLAFTVMFICIVVVWLLGQMGILGEFGKAPEIFHNYILIALLCLACGVQNATVTSVSKSVIRTTHLTGLTTDLGIGLARVFTIDKSDAQAQLEVKANLMRAGIIFCFAGGSAIGGVVFYHLNYLGFLFPVLTSFTIAAVFVVLRLRSKTKIESFK